MPVTLAPADELPTFDNSEIGYLTAVDGDILTIIRAQEGTIAKAEAEKIVAEAKTKPAATK